MPETRTSTKGTEALRQRLAALEEAQRATLNILEDFDEEKSKLKQLQRASLNLLEDMNEERGKSGETQRALMNIIEDAEAERAKAERAKALTEAANKELEAFSYSVSHDLRAPLRAISGYVEAVVEDYAPRLDDEGKRYLGLIRENAHKMGQLIEDLLAFSRLGRLKISRSPIDMTGLAEEVFAELAAFAPGRSLKFAARPAPPAYADRALVRQVLVNLLANAVKFTRPRAGAAIEFGCEDGAYYVRDNGVGFDMRYAGKLFGVFQRLHDVSEFEGTGVGLALVHRIVTRHGGLVRAQSGLNEGTTFYFTLKPGGEK